ncbi:transglutaminase family protein [Ancylobacter sp. 6x-1]|uniref:Transglutaminase family protein n=1 Tax=Ancylobacter crimeensis TaxID=2579147 RepID=A0ABT0D6V0_9HYPH|nr:transglutaminase family protein [Ancylobacter crimeensis]MCK0195676.1 transglutaminase family protein [Ancylobacter crimeensis]
MRIRFGYRLALDCAQPTPAMFLVDIHPSRRRDIEREEGASAGPDLRLRSHTDSFGNIVRRALLPAGRTVIENDGVVHDSGLPDEVVPDARQTPVADLPPDALPFLLPSRYCESDLVGPEAWSLFGHLPEGWARVQAIVDHVHQRITFGYPFADNTRTAFRSLSEGRGVCRDFAHLAVAMCRSMNIPARYCTGYLGDIGVPKDPAPMDFSAWFEVYLDGRWYSFDARHRIPRIGRVVIARGRDAADVAIVSTFGPHFLSHFQVWTDELGENDAAGDAPAALAAE